MTLDDFDAGRHDDTSRHKTTVPQVRMVAGAAIGRNELVRPKTHQAASLKGGHGAVDEPRICARRRPRAVTSVGPRRRIRRFALGVGR